MEPLKNCRGSRFSLYSYFDAQAPITPIINTTYEKQKHVDFVTRLKIYIFRLLPLISSVGT